MSEDEYSMVPPEIVNHVGELVLIFVIGLLRWLDSRREKKSEKDMNVVQTLAAQTQTQMRVDHEELKKNHEELDERVRSMESNVARRRDLDALRDSIQKMLAEAGRVQAQRDQELTRILMELASRKGE